MKFTTTESHKNASLDTIKMLFPYLWTKNSWRLKSLFLLCVTCLILSKVTNICVPLLFREIIDGLTHQMTGKEIFFVPFSIILAYSLTRFSAQFFTELKDILFSPVTQNAVFHVGELVLNKLHRLSLRFHLDRKTGAVSRAIERGTAGIETLMRFILFSTLPAFVEILLAGGLLWHLYGPSMAFVVVGTLVVYIIVTLRYTDWRAKIVREMASIDSASNAKAIDSLLNYETVKYFNNEEHESQQYGKSLKMYRKVAIKTQVTLSGLNILQAFIICVSLMIILSLSNHQLTQGTMTLGDFVLINTILLQLYIPLNTLGFSYREIKFALINMAEMFELLDAHEEIQDDPDATPLHITHGEITFENVDFSYNDDRSILHNISFQVASGKTVALVGASGAGKSTIARLLFRFYDVTKGRICIDGQDIRHVTQASLRQAIGVVPQDTVLFNDTIFYNIAYGKPSASQEAVETAARFAKIHNFIMSLPQGYDTPVGERGLKLSGGEKQRVAIARTILKNPSIFLFDEATSALDTHTEKDIQQSLRDISKHHTTLIIAHRLSTIVDADEILVFDQGKIVEAGTHATLLRAKGLYTSMWMRQQKEETLMMH